MSEASQKIAHVISLVSKIVKRQTKRDAASFTQSTSDIISFDG